jgi:putative tryptophan/tyrosine transport system substrate-binding protein
MNRSLFLRASAAALLADPHVMWAQQGPGRIYRLAILVQTGAPPATRRGTFGLALNSLGYARGQNLIVDVRGTDGDNRRFPTLVRELIALKPDVMVVETTPGVLAAKDATASIPIVMVNVSDPVGSGLVASLARPGGNVTGVTDRGDDMVAKMIELIREVVPGAKRIGVLMWDNPVHPAELKKIQAAAAPMGVSILPALAASADDVESAFAAMVAQKVDAFIDLGVASTHAQIALVPVLAAKARLPGIYPNRAWVEAGGLMAIGTNNAVKWRLAALYVDRILKGAKPADLPVQQPREREFAINTKTAESLGLIISPALLLSVDVVVHNLPNESQAKSSLQR